MNKNQQIRKKLSVLHEETKEGAWKLAYADFVTAMMCFFMLMWLLNATPSEKLKSMAMYFKPTISFFENPTSQKVNEEDNKNQINNSDNSAITAEEQADILNNIQLKLNTDFASDVSIQPLINNINIQMNKDGLEISIFNNNSDSMFKNNSIELTSNAKKILTKIVKSISYLPNRIIIGGHTGKMSNSLNSWDLSTGRAINAMKFMQMYGLPEEKVFKLNAYSDNELLDNENPSAAKNNRITITILTDSTKENYKDPMSKEALILNK